MKTIVLVSGGLDSTTALYWALSEGWDITALTFDIRQTSRMDLIASNKIIEKTGIQNHQIIPLPFYGDFHFQPDFLSTKSVSPDYLPVRNAIFYSIAAGLAESIGATQIISGSTIEDTIDLPDARSEFYALMNRLFRYGTYTGVTGKPIQILTPWIEKTHTEILKFAFELKVPIELTWSCYNDKPPACGKCRSCRARLSSFHQLGISDPIEYMESQD